MCIALEGCTYLVRAQWADERAQGPATAKCSIRMHCAPCASPAVGAAGNTGFDNAAIAPAEYRGCANLRRAGETETSAKGTDLHMSCGNIEVARMGTQEPIVSESGQENMETEKRLPTRLYKYRDLTARTLDMVVGRPASFRRPEHVQRSAGYSSVARCRCG